ncbi:L,D-transpeptidase [Candidatus Gracilibacteria bacterium]|nr:L,D-transpeptidase [Candidatus Gracilibacteria bacterium]
MSLNNQTNDINQSRRKFITGGIAVLAGIAATKKAVSQSIEEPELKLTSLEDDFSSDPALEAFNTSSNSLAESEKFVGKGEIEFFINHFGIDIEEFYNKVSTIQQEAGLDIDGILGPDTLKHIYKSYYSELNNLPHEMTIKRYLSDYFDGYNKHKNKQLVLSGLRSPFSKKYFYGEGVGENISGTYINQNLANFFESNGEQPGDSSLNGGNSIQIERNSAGKYYLALYVDGELKVLTYVSPGTSQHKTPQNTYNPVRGLRKYNVSGSYPETAYQRGGAIMPMSYQIDEGGAIFGHIGDVNGNGLSHGCIRTPALYQYAIYSILDNFDFQNFAVKVGKLY